MTAAVGVCWCGRWPCCCAHAAALLLGGAVGGIARSLRSQFDAAAQRRRLLRQLMAQATHYEEWRAQATQLEAEERRKVRTGVGRRPPSPAPRRALHRPRHFTLRLAARRGGARDVRPQAAAQQAGPPPARARHGQPPGDDAGAAHRPHPQRGQHRQEVRALGPARPPVLPCPPARLAMACAARRGRLAAAQRQPHATLAGPRQPELARPRSRAPQRWATRRTTRRALRCCRLCARAQPEAPAGLCVGAGAHPAVRPRGAGAARPGERGVRALAFLQPLLA